MSTIPPSGKKQPIWTMSVKSSSDGDTSDDSVVERPLPSNRVAGKANTRARARPSKPHPSKPRNDKENRVRQVTQPFSYAISSGASTASAQCSKANKPKFSVMKPVTKSTRAALAPKSAAPRRSDTSIVVEVPVKTRPLPRSSISYNQDNLHANRSDINPTLSLDSGESIILERAAAFEDAERHIDLSDDGDMDIEIFEVTQPTPFVPARSSELDSLVKSSLNPAGAMYDFTQFVRRPPANFISSEKPVAWVKIGEASYSEVFKCGDFVVKIIPVSQEDSDGKTAAMQNDDLPCLSDPSSVEKEIRLSHMMGCGKHAVAGFVHFRGYVA